jgi:hypothetical protein
MLLSVLFFFIKFSFSTFHPFLCKFNFQLRLYFLALPLSQLKHQQVGTEIWLFLDFVLGELPSRAQIPASAGMSQLYFHFLQISRLAQTSGLAKTSQDWPKEIRTSKGKPGLAKESQDWPRKVRTGQGKSGLA